MSDLLPCPFCGKKAMTWSSFSGWHIGCVIPSGIYRVGEMPVQHVLGPFHNEAEAIAAWNTRPTAPVEAVERFGPKGDPRQPWYAAWQDKGWTGTDKDKAMFREGFHAAAPHADPWACAPAPVEGRGEVHIHVDGAIAKTNGLLLDSLFEKGAPFEGRCKECLNIGHTIIHYRGHVIGNVPCANGCPEREPAPVPQGAEHD